MNKRLIYQNADGTLVVVIPVRPMRQAVIDPETSQEVTPAETEAEYLAAIRAGASVGAATYAGTIDAAQLPQDAAAVAHVVDEAGNVSTVPHPDPVRCARAAWRWDGAAVVIDAAQNLEVKKARLREARNRLLDISDALMARANETGQGAAAWKAYRQALRDLPANTPDPENVTWPAKPVS